MNRSLPPLLRPALTGTIAAIIALWTVGEGSAFHRVFLAEENLSRTYAIDHWAINGNVIRWCSDDNSFYYSNVIGTAYVEGLFAGAHWAQDCSVTSVWIRSYVSGDRCSASVGACTTLFHRYDAARQGDCVYAAPIWLNDQNWEFTLASTIAVVHHELGHVHGLDERYIESPPSCNPYEQTIMDAAVSDGVYIQSGCDGYHPSDGDLSRERAFYDPDPAQQPLIIGSPSTSVTWQWKDQDWAEASYKVSYYHWNGTSWAYIRTDDHPYAVAYGRGSRIGYIQRIFARPSGWPAGWYTSCIQTYNRIYGAKHWVCTPNAYLS